MAMKYSTHVDITQELEKARAKFPGKIYTFPALIEEVGELSQALMEQSRGGNTEQFNDNTVYKEGIQVIVMAIRLIEEGDRDFIYSHDRVTA